MKACAGFGHQRQIWRIGIAALWEVIGRNCRAVIAFTLIQILIPNFDKVRGIGPHFRFAKMWPALIAQGADRNELHAVARGANFCVDLQSAPQLFLIVRAKRTFKRKGVVVNIAFTSGSLHPASGEEQSQCETCCEFLEHISFPSHSAG